MDITCDKEHYRAMLTQHKKNSEEYICFCACLILHAFFLCACDAYIDIDIVLAHFMRIQSNIIRAEYTSKK